MRNIYCDNTEQFYNDLHIKKMITIHKLQAYRKPIGFSGRGE